MPDELRVGAVAFSIDPALGRADREHDRSAVRADREPARADGSTATGDALAQALELLRPTRRAAASGRPAAIVLLSDGKTTTGRDPRRGGARGAPGGGADLHRLARHREGVIATLRQRCCRCRPTRRRWREIAESLGRRELRRGRSRSELGSIYERLGSQIATRQEKREITAGFAAGGLVLLLSAAGLSLAGAGRLP